MENQQPCATNPTLRGSLFTTKELVDKIKVKLFGQRETESMKTPPMSDNIADLMREVGGINTDLEEIVQSLNQLN